MTALIDKFTDLSVIGVGAGSTIYKARYLDDDKIYAITAVKWIKRGDERYLKQAANEFQVAREFVHRNIIRMYDFERVRKFFKPVRCIVMMEYFHGRMLSPKHSYTMTEMMGIFIQVASALSYMHQMGYVHTDVKPENILADKNALVKVVDFGVACRRSETKVRVQGTPEYIAPEQLSKKPLDERTDIYNLGTTMFRILTGRVAPENVRMTAPLSGNGSPGAMSLAKQGVSQLNPKVPEKFAYVVEKCARRSRSKRFQNMREVLDALTSCFKEVAPPDHPLLEPAL